MTDEQIYQKWLLEVKASLLRMKGAGADALIGTSVATDAIMRALYASAYDANQAAAKVILSSADGSTPDSLVPHASRTGNPHKTKVADIEGMSEAITSAVVGAGGVTSDQLNEIVAQNVTQAVTQAIADQAEQTAALIAAMQERIDALEEAIANGGGGGPTGSPPVFTSPPTIIDGGGIAPSFTSPPTIN